MQDTVQETGLPIGTLVRISKSGRSYTALTTDGENVTDKLQSHSMKNAFRSNKALRLTETKSGRPRWVQVPPAEYDKIVRGQEVETSEDLNIAGDSSYFNAGMFNSHDELVDFIGSSFEIKPKKLRIREEWWKFAIRNSLRGENLLVVGPSGCGKTLLANCVKKALGREDKFFYVNLGSTQDPRSTLIGNTHYDPEQGTYVALSYFAQAIQTPNALILLDEVSRAHPEAHNILMTVLDSTQRYLRVDEKNDTETIHVADGVSFILTANVGSEYTATRTMDRALLDRCVMMEMEPLGYEDELSNLQNTFPNVENRILEAIAQVAVETRQAMETDDGRFDTIISTRMAERTASHVYDGFTFEEAAEVCIYPYFTESGGAESPRSQIRTLVQKFIPTQYDEKSTPFKGGSTKSKEDTPW